MGQTIGENEPGRSFVEKLLRDKADCEIEEAAEKYAINIQWRGDDYGVRKQYYIDCFTAGARHMQPKIAELENELTFRKAEIAVYKEEIAELEGGISMAITIMEHAIALECFTPKGSTERMAKDWISKYKDKIREGENGKAE